MNTRGYAVSVEGDAVETGPDKGRRSVGAESLLLATARFLVIGRLDESNPSDEEVAAVKALLFATFRYLR